MYLLLVLVWNQLCHSFRRWSMDQQVFTLQWALCLFCALLNPSHTTVSLHFMVGFSPWICWIVHMQWLICFICTTMFISWFLFLMTYVDMKNVVFYKDLILILCWLFTGFSCRAGHRCSGPDGCVCETGWEERIWDHYTFQILLVNY